MQRETSSSSGPPGEPLAYFFEDLFLTRKPQATRLYLIRHAQGEENVDPSAGGDAGLTEVGREQARRLAARLARQGLDAVYSSPLRRALETAEAVAQAAGLDVRVIDDLRELGLREGEDASAYNSVAAEAIKRRLLAHPTWDAFPGAEDRLAFRRRVVGAMDRVIVEQPGRRVAVVCHGGVIQTYVAHVLGLDIDFPFYAFNASVTSIRALGERRALWRLNDIAHLDGLPVGYEGIS